MFLLLKSCIFLVLYGPIIANQDLNRQEQIDLLSRLLCIQEDGLFNQQNISAFNEKADCTFSA